MGLYRAQLSVGPFRRGEIVEVDEAEFTRYIERGWLKPYSEGIVSVDAMHDAVGASQGAPPPEGEAVEADAPVGDVSSSDAAPDDASPPVE